MKNAWRGERDSGSLYSCLLRSSCGSSLPLYPVASTDSATSLTDHTQISKHIIDTAQIVTFIQTMYTHTPTCRNPTKMNVWPTS